MYHAKGKTTVNLNMAKYSPNCYHSNKEVNLPVPKTLRCKSSHAFGLQNSE